MASLINTLISTIKATVRVTSNVAQIVEVGTFYVEGFTGSMKDSIGKTPEEARDTGYKHCDKAVEFTKEGTKKLIDTFSIKEEQQPKKRGRRKTK